MEAILHFLSLSFHDRLLPALIISSVAAITYMIDMIYMIDMLCDQEHPMLTDKTMS